jgi:type I restriction enzyme M protein
MQADGYSLDDKRQPLLPEHLLGLQRPPAVREQLSKEEHLKNNLPDVLARWNSLKAVHPEPVEGSELTRPRTEQSFCVPKADIAANGYDLSINRYKEVVHAQVQHRAPSEILAELAKLEDEISAGMKALEGLLK